MSRINFSHSVNDRYTLLGIDGPIPTDWTGKYVIIEGRSYKPEIVYDLPNHIAIEGHGDFNNKEIEFPIKDR